MGTLLLPSGTSLRFGRSACRGFEPVPELEVTIAAAGPHPLGGYRATELTLESDSATYDALLAQRDAALGSVPLDRTQVIETAAATAEVLGWIVVLLDKAPPASPVAFRSWAQSLGLLDRGLRVSYKDDLRLGMGSHDPLVYLGPGPFPSERLRSLDAPPGFDPGLGFLTLSLGIPDMVPGIRASLLEPPDPWGANGSLRDLSRMALTLLEHGHAVILPQAGSLLPRERLIELLGDIDSMTNRPFGAWISLAVYPEQQLYRTFGMVVHGFPDVQLEAGSPETLPERPSEPLLHACHRMVWENRVLRPGQELEVASAPGEGGAPSTSRLYRVSAVDERIWLIEIPRS